MEDYIDMYLKFFSEFNRSVDTTDQLPVKIIAGNLRDYDIIGCVIDWTQQYLSARQCPSSLIAQICKYVVTEMEVYRAVDPGGCGYQKESNVWNPLKLMQATIRKVIDVCQRHKDRASVSKLTPPRSSMCLTILSASKNARRSMEDKYSIIDDLHEMLNIEGVGPGSFYGVFDGHGGPEAAMYSASRLFQCLASCPHYPARPATALVQAFKQCDVQYVEKAKAEDLQSGTTAVVALLLQELKQLYVAWIGDTQAIISRKGGAVSQLVHPPHRPNLESEKERIEEMGGLVLYFNGQCRVQGTLAVSRAIGDKDFKPYVCADPEVLCLDLDGSEDFLLLATDGLWEEVTELEVAVAVYTHLVQNSDKDLKLITDALINLAKSRGSKDNITVLLIFLRPPASIPAASILPRLAMESPPLASNGPPHYNGAPYHDDFGPETDVDGEGHHVKESKGLISADQNVLNLSSAGSSDSEEEGVEGGGWDFVQGAPNVKDSPFIQGGQNVKESLNLHSKSHTNFDSEASDDDMNHPLNPDAAEFVPVHSPVHKTNMAAHGDGFFGANGHGNEVHENGNGVHEKNSKENGSDIHGKDERESKALGEDEDVIACSPKKPKILSGLETAGDFLSEVSKRPSSGFELDGHEELNGFQPLAGSQSPLSPALHTGVKNPFDLSSESKAFETSPNAAKENFDALDAYKENNPFESSTVPFESNNGFSNDFTGTNQEVLHKETLPTGGAESGFTSQNGESDEMAERNDVERKPLVDDFIGKKVEDSPQDKADISDAFQHQDMADFTSSQFDAHTFSEYHTANDASTLFGKTNETLSLFGKEPAQTELTMTFEGTLCEVDNRNLENTLFDMPSGRRVSNETLEDFRAIAHCLDSPHTARAALAEDIASLEHKDNWFEKTAKKQEVEVKESQVETEVEETLQGNPFESEVVKSETVALEKDQPAEQVIENVNPFGEADEKPHQTVTDEFEFHQEANVSGNTVDISSNFSVGTIDVSNNTFTSVSEFDYVLNKTPSELNLDSVNIGALSPMDFASKQAAPSNDDIHGIHRDEEASEFASDKQEFNEDSIKEEDEEEIQIGKKVSDLNESDLMSRSFYGDYESQEPARSLSPEEMIDHYERQIREKQENTLEEHPDEITPTGDAKSLEAKLAQEDDVSHGEDTREFNQESQPAPQVTEQLRTESNLFDISHEEFSLVQDKSQETFDDLTFETKTETSEPKSPAPVETSDDFISHDVEAPLETIVESQETKVEPQETHVEQQLEKNIVQEPSQETKIEEAQEVKVDEPISIPDVVPTQGDEPQATPTVDLTQDIVEDVKLHEQVPSPQAEVTGEVKECVDLTTVAAAGALAVGAAATVTAVKKATSTIKKPEVKPIASKTAKPLAAKTSVSKTSIKPTTTAPKPAAKPAPKPLASKPLAPKPVASKVALTSTVPKAASTVPKKPVTSTLTKTSSSVSTAPKPLANKPAAPKPKSAVSAPAKPLTNGVAKRPVSATSTASTASRAPAAPRVPLSQRPTSKPATATTSKTTTGFTTAKPATSTTTKLTATKPIAGVKSSLTAKSSTSNVASTAVSKSLLSNSAAKYALAPKSPAKTSTVPAVKKSPVTRKPLSSITSKVGSLPAKTKPAMTKKTEQDSSKDSSVVGTDSKDSSELMVDTAPVEVMTNGH